MPLALLFHKGREGKKKWKKIEVMLKNALLYSRNLSYVKNIPLSLPFLFTCKCIVVPLIVTRSQTLSYKKASDTIKLPNFVSNMMCWFLLWFTYPSLVYINLLGNEVLSHRSWEVTLFL